MYVCYTTVVLINVAIIYLIINFDIFPCLSTIGVSLSSRKILYNDTNHMSKRILPFNSFLWLISRTKSIDKKFITKYREYSCIPRYRALTYLNYSSYSPIGSININNTRLLSTMSSTSTETKTEAPSVTLKPLKEHVEIFRKDYKPPLFDIEHVYLDFKLSDTETNVTAELVMRRKPNTTPGNLVLNGDELECKSVFVDGVELRKTAVNGYSLDIEGNLTIPASFLPPDSTRTFLVKTSVIINPTANLKLMGLYKSRKLFCTQCEPHGFRRMTYFLDRPDVMSSFKVRVEANKKEYPVLLSNGNRVEEGSLDDGSHYAIFVDPFPKPCYLFALVAGDLSSISSTYRTMSGRDVKIQISAEAEDCDKLHWALESVIKAMKWDEEAYGREYDLGEFHIVSVSDFNFGAMENKGLNIFNTAVLLADLNTTTDSEFTRITRVVGHEYFHNWTGNRVTCRDWFQLTLKEGLTVFRDSEFGCAVSSKLLNRIKDVRYLMSKQFAEDAGPMAHPIRPESYISVDNFYTSTVYDKGSFVIGMYKVLLGEDGFRKGMDLYFERHDHQAVSCDDFRAAMADANNKDLTQFENWYTQAGTPTLEVLESGRVGNSYRLKIKQSTPPTPRQPVKLPFHIPVVIGLVGKESKRDIVGTKVLELTKEVQEFAIENITEDCVLSFNRNFSAPVKVKHELTDDELLFLMVYDTDELNRWNSAQTILSKLILNRVSDMSYKISKLYLDAFKTLLNIDMSYDQKALCLTLPDTDILSSQMRPYDPELLHKALRSVEIELSDLFYNDLLSLYNELKPNNNDNYNLDKDSMANRLLRNTLLSYLSSRRDLKSVELCLNHYHESKYLNDKYYAFMKLLHMDFTNKEDIILDFYNYANGNPLAIDKWFVAQALSESDDCLDRLISLTKHNDFSITNPNRFNSLITSFSYGVKFHDINGRGYQLLTDFILQVDKINPQISSRCCSSLLRFSIFDETRKNLMIKEINKLYNTPNISPNLYEVTKKALEFNKNNYLYNRLPEIPFE